jgi:hypothetical protein
MCLKAIKLIITQVKKCFNTINSKSNNYIYKTNDSIKIMIIVIIRKSVKSPG